MITGNKDIDKSIFMSLSDRDLLQACVVNKYTNKEVCNESFYKLRLYNNYKEIFDYFKDKEVKDWRKLYLNLIYILDKSEVRNFEKYFSNKIYSISDAIRQAIQRNDINLLEYFDKSPPEFMLYNPTVLILNKVKWDEELHSPMYMRHFEIVRYILIIKNISSGYGLELSILLNDIPLIESFIEKGAQDWNLAARVAAKSGNINLMKYFANKGRIDWENVRQSVEKEPGLIMYGIKLTPKQKESVLSYINTQLN